jgi:hypothetical protein
MRHSTGCRHQTSVIAGTVMHGTHLPLRKWFLAAYLVATHSNGISSGFNASAPCAALALGNAKPYIEYVPERKG